MSARGLPYDGPPAGSERPVKITDLGDVTTVRIAGELDLALAARAAPVLNQTVGSVAGPVVLDLRAVTFLDASGIDLLMGFYQRLDARGRRLAIVTAARQPIRVLSLTGLTSQLPLHPTLDSALAAVRPPESD